MSFLYYTINSIIPHVHSILSLFLIDYHLCSWHLLCYLMTKGGFFFFLLVCWGLSMNNMTDFWPPLFPPFPSISIGILEPPYLCQGHAFYTILIKCNYPSIGHRVYGQSLSAVITFQWFYDHYFVLKLVNFDNWCVVYSRNVLFKNYILALWCCYTIFCQYLHIDLIYVEQVWFCVMSVCPLFYLLYNPVAQPKTWIFSLNFWKIFLFR